MKSTAASYHKIVTWSEADGCYVGRCPELMLGGVHGPDERKVFAELCSVVDEWVRLAGKDKVPLPKPKLNRAYSGKLLLRIPPETHRDLAVQAELAGVSLNHLCRERLSAWPAKPG